MLLYCVVRVRESAVRFVGEFMGPFQKLLEEKDIKYGTLSMTPKASYAESKIRRLKMAISQVRTGGAP